MFIIHLKHTTPAKSLAAVLSYDEVFG